MPTVRPLLVLATLPWLLFVGCAVGKPSPPAAAGRGGADAAEHAARAATVGVTTPPIVAPPGYVVELLRMASPDEGSWVSLCVDPSGRLYASDQGGRGLRRFTPTADGVVDEPVDVDFSGAQGLLWWRGALHAMRGDMGEQPGGLFRLTDSDGDDALDRVESLRTLHGSGEHGWHALVPAPDGTGLLAVGGNQTVPTELDASRVPPYWGEDQLLPRLPDAGGFMTDALAPGGCIYHVSPDGQRWELLSMGYRNPYDLAVHPSGEVFTVDADMEWDLNTPWYRPTRVCLVSSGSDYGWRNGSGKFPPSYLDTLPPVLELGPGSPVGMTFGHGTDFPARDREALFVGDWSYGRVHAVHLEPDGAGWRGHSELFLSGTPLPVTDLVVNPRDGALYFVTGGRNVRGGLYRVRWIGDGEGRRDIESSAREPDPESAVRQLRSDLEALHGFPFPGAVDQAWPQLGHGDRFVRSAARVALEWQPVELWRQRALDAADGDPRTAIPALAALARVGGRDAPHRSEGDGPDPILQREVLDALARVDWQSLEDALRQDLLRVTSLAITRLGESGEPVMTEPEVRDALISAWSPRFPSGSPRVDVALCELLVSLQDPRLAARAVEQLHAAPTQEEQLDYARCLRRLDAGWTPELRRRYAGWFGRASAYHGGASFAGYVRSIQADAAARLSGDQREAFLEWTAGAGPGTSPLSAMQLPLGSTRTAHPWTAAELLPIVQSSLAEDAPVRDLARGRMLFGAAGCFACHRVAGEGGIVGPDLTGAAGRFALADLLDAVIDPSSTVSDQYERSNLHLRDGEVLTGRIVNLSGNRVDVSTDLFRPGDVVSVDRAELESITPSTVSSMPEGLIDLLDEAEIADLMAWLLSAR